MRKNIEVTLKQSIASLILVVCFVLSSYASYTNASFSNGVKLNKDAGTELESSLEKTQGILKKEIKFRIWCELSKGKYAESDNCPVKYQKNIKLLNEFLNFTYKNLPTTPFNLKETAKQTVFFVTQWKEITETYLGYSAEDDPEYIYPNTHFAIKLENPTGIKNAFTKKCMQVVELVLKEKYFTEKARIGGMLFLEAIVGHELRHSADYNNIPASRMQFIDGLVVEETLKPAKLKLKYEEVAFALGRNIIERDVEAYKQFIKEFDIFERKAHPEYFKKGGKYHLLSRTRKNPFYSYYLVGQLKMLDKKETFTEAEKINYNGQFDTAEIVLKLKKLNDKLEKESLGKEPIDLDKMYESFKQLEAKWDYYIYNGKKSESLISGLSGHFAELEARYWLEYDRFQMLFENCRK